jgi:hypothetical protein
MTKGVVPPDLVEDVGETELCEMLHCLPSQLDGEDYHRLMRMLAIYRTLQNWRSMEAKS